MEEKDISAVKTGGNKTADTVMNIIDILADKYLYPLLFLLGVYVTFPVVGTIIENSGVIMYYTADNSILGGSPSRFFGLLSFIGDIKAGLITKTFIFVGLYLFALLLVTSGLYMLLKLIGSLKKKLIVIFVLTLLPSFILLALPFQMIALSKMFAAALTEFAVYFMLRSKKLFIAPIFSFAAIIADCCSVFILLPAALYLFLRKKEFAKASIIVMCFTAAAFAVSMGVNSTYERMEQDECREVLIGSFADSCSDPDQKALYVKEIKDTIIFDGYPTLNEPMLICSEVLMYEKAYSYLYTDKFQQIFLTAVIISVLYYLSSRAEFSDETAG